MVDQKDKLKIGIIGTGRFGSLLEKIFIEHGFGEVVMTGQSRPQGKINYVEFHELVNTDMIIPAVPIAAMQSVLKQIASLKYEGHVIDVCSVKVMPVKWMKELLPDSAKIIASHPMFGPDSTKDGTELEDKKLMTQNISGSVQMYERWMSFWQNLGINIIQISAEEHDKYAAYSMNYNHLIGRIGERVGIKQTPINTKGFDVILDAMQYVTKDTWELFESMQKYNPYAREMIYNTKVALDGIISDLFKDEDINTGS